ncbi:hypothetical protein OS175_03115 [Marinicella sp. S1101]|uniref:hypothetical protein n=1 Tax=Marinicella marina TaxID=2996016 RepID=UPI0022609521|nr:hypothetical protein [Marinicella marina]MCX7552858.1 hypothetical protein [Marinicella marina]MDJ1139833.1 hypothetical protein [Marinicella marina]
MLKINNYLLVLSFLLAMVSFTKRNDFTADFVPHPLLKHEPIQQSINQQPYNIEYQQETFTIMPKYDYELFGLVVSYRLHDSDGGWMIHAQNKDHINVADYCVVWGASADASILAHFSFSNGQFTCNFQTQSNQAWEAFNQNQISNNHLLAVDEHLRETIDEINIGDVIHIKGKLAHYINPLGGERGTSVVRTDTGNGACETIWVEAIGIIDSMTSIWRTLLTASLIVLILTVLIYLRAPYAPHKLH